MLADFLNDMDVLEAGGGPVLDIAQEDPAGWGDLVISRAADGGDILFIDPELYWNGIAEVFRSHGDDPHPYRRHESQ